jgi:Leucine-rich repeat (LRR) protein
LRYISLHFNQLTQIPNVDKHTALERLFLSNNPLTQGPRLDKNTALKQLGLSNNQLTQSPRLDKNTQLKYLLLHNNQLTQSPGLDKLAKLKYLYLHNNQLTQSPSVLTNKELFRVGLASNQLTSIPAEMNQLPNLKYLDVSDNDIRSLDTLMTPAAGAGDSATSLLEGRNETLLLLGGNPVCVNGNSGEMSRDSGGTLGATWFASCQSQCSRTCRFSVSWEPASIEQWSGGGTCWFGCSSGAMEGSGLCDLGCNTTACSYDGGDCLEYRFSGLGFW